MDKKDFLDRYAHNEADLYRWEKEDGVYFLIIRDQYHCFLCGYISVPKGHILYEDVFHDYEAHGGITFDRAGPVLSRKYPLPFESDFRVIGFDCGHLGDISTMNSEGTYKDYWFVLTQLKGLYKQMQDRKRELEKQVGALE